MKQIIAISILFLFSCEKEVNNIQEDNTIVSQGCYCGTVVTSSIKKVTVKNNCSGNEIQFDAQMYVDYNYGDAYCTTQTW